MGVISMLWGSSVFMGVIDHSMLWLGSVFSMTYIEWCAGKCNVLWIGIPPTLSMHITVLCSLGVPICLSVCYHVFCHKVQ